MSDNEEMRPMDAFTSFRQTFLTELNDGRVLKALGALDAMATALFYRVDDVASDVALARKQLGRALDALDERIAALERWRADHQDNHVYDVAVRNNESAHDAQAEGVARNTIASEPRRITADDALLEIDEALVPYVMNETQRKMVRAVVVQFARIAAAAPEPTKTISRGLMRQILDMPSTERHHIVRNTAKVLGIKVEENAGVDSGIGYGIQGYTP